MSRNSLLCEISGENAQKSLFLRPIFSTRFLLHFFLFFTLVLDLLGELENPSTLVKVLRVC
jgi:hypothetical protein